MKVFYTHAGRFHADEITALAILKVAELCYKYERLRQINLDNLIGSGFIVDIGRQYDHERLMYDHHQEFLKRPNGMPYASAGLIWKHYGRDAILKHLGVTDEDEINFIHEYVDKNFIQGIDAHDADSSYKAKGECSAGEVNIITLPDVIGTFNHTDVFHSIQDVFFENACLLVQKVLYSILRQAYAILADTKSFKEKAKFYLNGTTVVIEEYIPSLDYILQEYPDVLYVITVSSHPNNKYSMLAVKKNPKTRELRKTIERPNWFEGFIHLGKWIAGSNDIEELLRLAEFNVKRD